MVLNSQSIIEEGTVPEVLTWQSASRLVVGQPKKGSYGAITVKPAQPEVVTHPPSYYDMIWKVACATTGVLSCAAVVITGLPLAISGLGGAGATGVSLIGAVVCGGAAYGAAAGAGLAAHDYALAKAQEQKTQQELELTARQDPQYQAQSAMLY